MSTKKSKPEIKRQSKWGETLTPAELTKLLKLLDNKKAEKEKMAEEIKKSKNPFINAANAAKAAAANPRVPADKTAKVQQAKFKDATVSNKPAKKSAGRGR